jgi:hypothetical protein
MAWLARDTDNMKFQRVIIIGFLITLGAMAIAGTLSGALNALGWLSVGIDSLLFIAFIFFLIYKHGSR